VLSSSDNAGFVVSAALLYLAPTKAIAMTLKQQITEDMKTAMRSHDKQRLGVIRLMLAALKQREVDERIELEDVQVMATLEKMLKQRRDSVSQFDAAGRDDLSAIERDEMTVIETYLPSKLDDAEIDALITAAIAETGASSPRDMGKVVAAVKTKAAGRADMATVSSKVKAKLAG
jgi:uncharacterized protein YqeY